VRRRAARGGARLAQGAQGRVCNGGSRATSAPPPPPPPLLAGAIEEYVGSAEELLQIVRIGDANRVVGSTGMNDVSSRSHSVLQIGLEVRDTATRSLQHSKLCLVDLAGSESVSRTGAEGVVLDEARTINKSLFNLAKVINSLTEEGVAAQHIPYRDSKCVTAAAACAASGSVVPCLLLAARARRRRPATLAAPPSPARSPRRARARAG